MANKVVVSGEKGNILVALNGETIESGLTVVEAFMILAGLCRKGARPVKVSIEEPQMGSRLFDLYAAGADARKVFAERKAQEHAMTVLAAKRATEEIELLKTRLKNETELLAGLKSKLTKSGDKSHSSRKSK